MASKNLPKRCPVFGYGPHRPPCTLLDGHDGGCNFLHGTLTPREEAVWLSAFGCTSNPRTADDRVRDLQSHLASDEPSLLKNPYPDPQDPQ